MFDIYNARELALLFWLIAFIIWVLTHKSIRASIVGLIRAAFAWRLSIIYALMALYTVGMVYLLYSYRLWDVSQLKNTILWFITVGLVSLSHITDDKKENYLKITVKDIFSYTALLQFIINVYTFNFIVELLIVPIGVLIFGMIAFGKRDPKNKPVINFLNNLIALFGVYLIGYTIYRIVHDFHSFANRGTLNDFLIPATLSFLFLPLVYVISIFVSRESVFILLNRDIPNPKLLRFARWQTFINFNFSKSDLRRWRSIVLNRQLKSKTDIRTTIQLIKDLKAIERNPPAVPFAIGWSPYQAKNFLSALGIETKYYHPYWDDEGWYTTSNYFKIDESKFLDTISYHIEGDRTVARDLKLVLNVFSRDDANISVESFIAFVRRLYSAAMKENLPEAIEKAIRKEKNTTLEHNGRRISVVVNRWQGHKRHGYNIDFSIAMLPFDGTDKPII